MSYLASLVANAVDAINQASDIITLDNIRVAYLGKKGYLAMQMNIMRKLSIEERSLMGAEINKAKEQIYQMLNMRKAELKSIALNSLLDKETIDISLPGRRIENGGLHPVTCTINRIEYLFSKLGFTVVTGPEIEDSYHNFDALNIPYYHPARTDNDTFWFNATCLLRTQTSNVQIRTMKENTPPIRIIAPGRVYRKDYDHNHTPMFHQVEGLIIDENINFTNLKGTMYDFLCNFFEKEIQIRFRPSYFPFTEPSAEIDIINENGKWLEILGCGMVHPNELHNVNIDPEIYSGFAFGIGIERLTALRYNITDIRVFFENDLRFLKQFR